MTQRIEPDTLSPTTIDHDDALASIAATMGRLRMMMGRRFMARIALSQLTDGHGLELSHFDTVKIVAHAEQNQEVTVGAIAEQMRIDPSRASRVVADLVRRGMVRRDVSQQDARRTIVALTQSGKALSEHFERVRREVIGQALADWSAEDIGTFEVLFDRFILGLESRAPALKCAVAKHDDDQR